MKGETWICLGAAAICCLSIFGHLWILEKLKGLFESWKAIVHEDWKKRGIS